VLLEEANTRTVVVAALLILYCVVEREHRSVKLKYVELRLLLFVVCFWSALEQLATSKACRVLYPPVRSTSLHYTVSFYFL
jgi:hypothetical protein